MSYCAGATGLVGSRLTAKLASQGNKVRVVTRNVNSAKSKLQYPGLEFYSLAQIADAVKGSNAVVNLAGEPIGTRWGRAVLQEPHTPAAAFSPGCRCNSSGFPAPLHVHNLAGWGGGCRASAMQTQSLPSSDRVPALRVCRWTPEIKKQIKQSRLDITGRLAVSSTLF